jgi:HPt (histidine-containing phosphotransfer) domain-containing protein
MRANGPLNELMAALDSLPTIDLAVAAPLYDPELGGDAEFLAEIVQAFRDDTPLRLGALRTASEQGDADALVRASHSVKGSSGNFGAMRLQGLCLEIERRGRAGEIVGLAPLIERAEVEYERLVLELEKLIASAQALE